MPSQPAVIETPVYLARGKDRRLKVIVSVPPHVASPDDVLVHIAVEQLRTVNGLEGGTVSLWFEVPRESSEADLVLTIKEHERIAELRAGAFERHAPGRPL
jgi:hypothetical protein